MDDLAQDFQLSILLTTAGAAVGAGLIKTIVSALKGMGLLPDHGRALLLVAGALAILLMGLAVWDAAIFSDGDGVTAQEIFTVLLATFGLYSASVGVHETAVKVQNIMQGTTNPTGPDRG